MKNKDEEDTTEDNLLTIETSSKILAAFIEGLEAAAILQGKTTDEVYKVGRLWGTASNIKCYCSKVREKLKQEVKE